MKKLTGWRKQITVVMLGWMGLTVFFSVLHGVSEPGTAKAFDFVLYATAVEWGLWMFALPLLAQCVERFPFSHGDRLRHGAVLLLVALVLAALIWLTWLATIYWTWFPYRQWFPSFTSMLNGEFARSYLRASVLVGLGIVMALQFRRARQEFLAERMRASELERQLAESQLAALRMQLHPHFLFNTLHAIAGLIGDQPTTARRMVASLGDFLRLTLKDGRTSTRPLAEELEFVDLYMGIEKLRLGDRLILDYEIEPDAATAEVPHLLLQPLFENAVKHGAARLTGACRIAFHAHRENGRLNLCLENDGLVCLPAPNTPKSVMRLPPTGWNLPPVSSHPLDTPGHGVGLTNTMARLSLHYGENFTFQYTDRPQGGVRIDLSLPWRKAER